MKFLILAGIFMFLALLNYCAFGADDGFAPVKLTISTPKAKLQLGDWIEINYKMENIGREKVKAINPIIDVYSVSLVLEYNGEEKSVEPISDTLYTPVTFTHTVYTPSVYESKPTKEHLVKTSLEPGKSLTAVFKIPAIKLGQLKITAVENGISGNVKPSNTIALDISLSDKDKNKQLVAVFDTNQGKIVSGFYPDYAPNHVLCFVKLAKQGFYDKGVFHRVIKGFMIQGGSPNRDGSSGPGYSIKAEFNKQKHLDGTLSMARSNHNDSAGSQFYICLAPQGGLDNQYTVFGQTVKGMDVVKKIGDTPTTGPRGVPADRPRKDMVVNKVTIELMEIKIK